VGCLSYDLNDYYFCFSDETSHDAIIFRISSSVHFIISYLGPGTEEQQRRWTQVYDIAGHDATLWQLIAGFACEMKILVHSGIWCGDCVE
jgi:hypothetical protein